MVMVTPASKGIRLNTINFFGLQQLSLKVELQVWGTVQSC